MTQRKPRQLTGKLHFALPWESRILQLVAPNSDHPGELEAYGTILTEISGNRDFVRAKLDFRFETLESVRIVMSQCYEAAHMGLQVLTMF